MAEIKKNQIEELSDDMLENAAGGADEEQPSIDPETYTTVKKTKKKNVNQFNDN